MSGGALDHALVEQPQTDLAGELVVRRRAQEQRFPAGAPVETLPPQADRQAAEKVGVGVEADEPVEGVLAAADLVVETR